MTNENKFKLADTTIAHVAKLLQLSILSGTDVVDHLRTLELVTSDLGLVPATGYLENFEINIARMVEEAASWREESGDTELVVE
jgi:hypothetical protein